MNYASSSLSKTEIVKQLGYFPAFLTPALDSSPIYHSLAHQTLFAYINNPLPPKFKEKLFITLSRYANIRYFTICHSCTLYSLGASAADILELANIRYLQTVAEVEVELQSLQEQWQRTNWQNNPLLETRLLQCCNFIFLQNEQIDKFSAAFKELLGSVRYHYLVILLGYIKQCHQWVANNQDICHQQDRRSQLYLGSLLLENAELARFFNEVVEVKSPPVVVSASNQNGGSSSNISECSQYVSSVNQVYDCHQTELPEAETKLNLVLDATKTGIWHWNLTTNKIDLCDRGRAILGLYDFDGSYDRFLQIVHPNEREAVDLEAARVIQNRRDLDLKYRIVKSNQAAVIHAKGKLEYDAAGNPIALAGILTDITPTFNRRNHPLTNRQRQIPIRTSQLEAIANSLPYYLFAIDPQTQTISLLNSKLAQSLNISPIEAKGKTLMECFAPDYAKQIALHHQQAIASGRLLHLQERAVFADGVHCLDTVVTPLRDREGEIYALLQTSHELPELAATKKALSQRTIQLEAANRELESFSYSVSHDLQAPLRVINGFSEVLWENYQGSLDDRGKHYLQRIQANSKRMSDLIDALLELSRVTRSQMKAVGVNLSAIAKDIVEELQIEYPEREVKVKIAPNLKTTGDPQLLRIVLRNLLDNAWKYTSKRLSAEIEFGLGDTNEAQNTYYLRDNGAGFDMEYVEKLFTAFQRLHSQAEFPGTGIGLATVQRIIYRHGGRVWAEGKRDRGATIYFSL